MADGDVLIDSVFETAAPPGYRFELFACEDSRKPNGVKYRFQCDDPTTGETVLRYDNSHDHPTAGWHHRHENELDEPIPIAFEGLHDHLNRFRQEVFANDD